jgi:hypothetical protein
MAIFSVKKAGQSVTEPGRAGKSSRNSTIAERFLPEVVEPSFIVVLRNGGCEAGTTASSRPILPLNPARPHLCFAVGEVSRHFLPRTQLST